MDTLWFGVLRRALHSQAPPGASAELEELGQAYKGSLAESGIFSDVDVAATDNADELIAANVHYSGDLDPDRVIDELERLWFERLAHPFWEAHSVKRNADEVALEGASRFGEDGPYVTVRVTARSATIPQQRTAS